MLTRLYTPLLAVVALASTVALIVALMADVYAPLFICSSVFWIPIIIILWIVFTPRRDSFLRYAPRLFLWLVAAGILVYFMTMGCSDPCQISWGLGCENNLKQIGVALHNYHEKYGSLPPAYVTDKNGKPMHSWRTLILPFMEQKELHDLYDFNEPWDGPHNRLLLRKEPRIFVCPFDYDYQIQNSKSGHTSYLAIVGENTPWKGAEPTKLSDMRDGCCNTILAIDVSNSDVAWTEPRDIKLDAFSEITNPDSATTLSAKHWFPRGFFWKDFPGSSMCILKADASVCHMPAYNLSPKLLEGISKLLKDNDEASQLG